jgi:hypothetical protein
MREFIETDPVNLQKRVALVYEEMSGKGNGFCTGTRERDAQNARSSYARKKKVTFGKVGVEKEG